MKAELWQGGPRTEELGEISIPSGAVTISDAGIPHGVRVAVSPANGSVRILRNEDGDNVAAALVFPEGEPVDWTEAGTYGVDCGLSGFGDSELLEQLDKQTWEISSYDDLISLHLEPREDEGHAGALIPFQGNAFSACRSGYGDGVYAVHVGRNREGRVAAIVTVFIDNDT